MLIDTHCHLDDDRLFPEADSIIKSFETDGLYAVVSSSSDMESAERNFSLASTYDKVYATVGVHPHEAKSLTDEDLRRLEEMATSQKVVAVGEIGLDYYYDLSPREKQVRALYAQLELAHSLKLPVVFHVRDAYADFLTVIRDAKKYLQHGGVLHCYSGSAEFLKELYPFDFYYGFDGPITFKNARHALEAIKEVPEDRLLVETDAPYLSPVPYRGKINYPKYVAEVAKKAAELRGISFEKLSEIEINNTKTLFKRLK